MSRLCVVAILVALPIGVSGGEPSPNITATINRGLAFLANDNLTWRKTRQCTECHHAPMTIWALNEGKKRGYAVDKKTLSELSAWAVAKDIPAKAVAKPAKPQPIDLNEAPLVLALGVEAGDNKLQEGLKKLLGSVLRDQNPDGSWKLSNEFRPIGSSSTPEVLTTLALLALSSPNAPDMGADGKAAIDRGLKWLRAANSDPEPQAAACG